MRALPGGLKPFKEHVRKAFYVTATKLCAADRDLVRAVTAKSVEEGTHIFGRPQVGHGVADYTKELRQVELRPRRRRAPLALDDIAARVGAASPASWGSDKHRVQLVAREEMQRVCDEDDESNQLALRTAHLSPKRLAESTAQAILLEISAALATYGLVKGAHRLQMRCPLFDHILWQANALLDARYELVYDRLEVGAPGEYQHGAWELEGADGELPLPRIEDEGPRVRIKDARREVEFEERRVATNPDQIDACERGILCGLQRQGKWRSERAR